MHSFGHEMTQAFRLLPPKCLPSADLGTHEALETSTRSLVPGRPLSKQSAGKTPERPALGVAPVDGPHLLARTQSRGPVNYEARTVLGCVPRKKR